MPTTILDPFQKVNLSTGHVNLEKNGEIITNGNAGNDTEILNNQNEKSVVKGNSNNPVDKIVCTEDKMVSESNSATKYNLRQRKLKI